MTVSFREVMDEGFKSFEPDLIELFGLLDHIHAIEFYDRLVEIAIEIIKMLPINSPIYNIVQKHLFDLLEKDDKTMRLLFDLFYYWCKNGRYFITTENPSLLQDVNFSCYLIKKK